MLAVDVLLFAPLVGMASYALARSSEEVADGAGYVTTASNVAWAILSVFVLLTALHVTRLPPDLKRTIRWAAAISTAFHAVGLLAGLYAGLWWYDDALHVTYAFGAAVLLVRVAQALRIFPPAESTPLRAALLGIVAAFAVAAAWEIFEYALGIIQSSRLQADLDDTMLDMIDGAVGGIVASAWLAFHPTRPGRRDASASEDAAAAGSYPST